ncbi:MAG TPA: hypothetical protein VIQ31_23330, partial [Phormidium sp.]
KVVQAPGFIRGINPFSKIENPQSPAFIRGVNLKSQISNLKSIDLPAPSVNSELVSTAYQYRAAMLYQVDKSAL